MTKKISRRSFLKTFMKGSAFTLFASLFGYSYAREIEPRMLDITTHNIISPLIPQGFEGIKIVQFSDTHLGPDYSLQQLEKVVSAINEQKPDIVLFTGDLIDNFSLYTDTEKVAPILKRIKAPLGKFSIYGNHDHGGAGSRLYKQLMGEADFRLLKNEVATISSSDSSHITISGLDDFMLGKPEINKTLHSLSKDMFNILLVHEPDIADQLSKYPVHLQLSGHSHGGQVQIPFYGPLITPPLAQKYTEGFYTLKQKQHDMQIYVNKGIGTTNLPFRFLCPPEIIVFVLQRE